MSLNIYEADGTPINLLKLTCIDHPQYEGTRQSKAYLEGCPGCRAVYHVCKALKPERGRMVGTLRIEV